MRTVNWMIGFLLEIKIDRGSPPLLFNDTQACVTVPISGSFKSDNRHLGERCYSICVLIALGTLTIEHTARDEMLADALAKPSDGTESRIFISRLGMVLSVGLFFVPRFSCVGFFLEAPFGSSRYEPNRGEPNGAPISLVQQESNKRDWYVVLGAKRLCYYGNSTA